MVSVIQGRSNNMGIIQYNTQWFIFIFIGRGGQGRRRSVILNCLLLLKQFYCHFFSRMRRGCGGGHYGGESWVSVLEYHQPPPHCHLVLAMVLNIQLYHVWGPEIRPRGERLIWGLGPCRGPEGRHIWTVPCRPRLDSNRNHQPCQHDTAANC